MHFVTVHPEGVDTDLYRLDAQKFGLRSARLPCAGLAIVSDATAVWVAGSNRRVYRCDSNNLSQADLGLELSADPESLALLSNDRLAILAGSELTIIDRNNGQQFQVLALSEDGSALAHDPSGNWLAVGTARGNVSIFESEGKSDFTLSDTQQLHEGPVTALLFENDELRFFSAGADQKLLHTHARGRLEPEDKGRGNNHKDNITAMIHGPSDRILTGSRDGTVKNWPRVGRVQPSTTDKGVSSVTNMALVTIETKPHLLLTCDDNSIRVFPFDETAKVDSPIYKILDTYALARHQFDQDEVERRQNALTRLAGYNDTRSIEMIANRVSDDSDHELRRKAAELLGDSGHPRAAKLLEKHLKHSDEAVRLVTLTGLRKLVGPSELRPLTLAIKAGKADVGVAAVEALQQLAATDDQAHELLVKATGAETFEVRRAALFALEQIHTGATPEASLLALASDYEDIRRLALIRIYQRNLLDNSQARSAVRRSCEDEHPSVRHTSFLLSLLARPQIVVALRARDAELHRQLHELETFQATGPVKKTAGETKRKLGEMSVDETLAAARGKARLPAEVADESYFAADPQAPLSPQPAVTTTALEPADYEPLLQAMASWSSDTCLFGARCLALLGDTRAFGVLLQLSREENAKARADVCRAFGALKDPRCINRLRSMLNDAAAEVRDSAFTALAELYSNRLLAVEAALSCPFEDIHRRGLQVLVEELREPNALASGKAGDAPVASAIGSQTLDLLVRALNDNFKSVRNEAFKTCLNLKVAGGDAGTLRFVLRSIHADIRREVLTEVMAQRTEDWAWQLLLEFFYDPDPRLRKEAFDFALDKSKDEDFGPLESALASRFEDTRLRATQDLAKRHTDASQNLLVKVLGDQDKDVRRTAIEALISTDAVDALAVALSSQFVDVRLQAATARARHGDSAAREPLVDLATAAEPEEGEAGEKRELWQTNVTSALEGLTELGDPATLPHIVPLLHSPHASIRRAAAKTSAWISRSEEADSLRAALQHADQHVRHYAALGLALCGDASSVPLLFAPTKAKKSKTKGNVKQALGAVKGSSFAENIDAIECHVAAHPHDSVSEIADALRHQASLSNPFIAKVVAAIESQQDKVSSTGLEFDMSVGTPDERLVAAFVLGNAGEDYLISFLDSDDERLWGQALMLLLILDLKQNRSVPRGCLACLASRHPRVRLAAAAAIDCYADRQRFLDFIVTKMNDRGDDKKPWEIATATVDQFADLAVFAQPNIRARTVALFDWLSHEKQNGWDQAWTVHEARFRGQFAHVPTSVQPISATDQQSSEQFRQLAFGAYVGLVREQGTSHSERQQSSLGPAIIAIRVAAVNRLMELAQTDTQFEVAARPVLIQALSDPNQPVRFRAFEHLKTLGMDRADLGAEALQAGSTDIGVAGLELLIEGAEPARLQSILEEVMMTRNDHLATEAAKLLIERTTMVAVATKGLGASFDELRQQSVRWLSDDYDKNDSAKAALREAMSSRYRAVRRAAAIDLATKKDSAAFDTLVELLKSDDKGEQKQIINGLEALDDDRVGDALIDRVENDPGSTAHVDRLLQAAGNCRKLLGIDRLLRLMEKEELRNDAFRAAWTISGFDQTLVYESDEMMGKIYSRDEVWYIVNNSWCARQCFDAPPPESLKPQHPRHGEVIARLLQRCFQLAETKYAANLLEAAIWSHTSEVDPVMSVLASHPSDEFRNAVIETIGWRVRHRAAPTEPLERALEHRDPNTKFLAAEWLARAGRDNGINILLTGIELMADVNHQCHAIEALGELADERALDVLLKYANNDGHVLQEPAAEAIGHLGKSSKADEILEILKRFAKREDGVAERAFRGLRWFDTPSGWQLLRDGAEKGHWTSQTAIEMLSYNDEPVTRDLLLKVVLRGDDGELVRKAHTSARRLFGAESLEPDYAYLKHEDVFEQDHDPDLEILDRVCTQGDPARIFEIYPGSDEFVEERLRSCLLNREMLPVNEAVTAVESNRAGTAKLAAHILGRADMAGTIAGPALERAIDHWQAEWASARKRMYRDQYEYEQKAEEIAKCLGWLMWAAGQLGVARHSLLSSAEPFDDPKARQVRLAALSALCEGDVDGAVCSVLESAALDEDHEIRAFANTMLAEHNPSRASALAGEVLSDRVSFNRLARQADVDVGQVVLSAAPQAHYQPIALPHLIATANTEVLNAVAVDDQLPESTRLGAIEGLGRIATEGAEARLKAFGESEEDETLRKAAWRAVRRSQRQRERN